MEGASRLLRLPWPHEAAPPSRTRPLLRSAGEALPAVASVLPTLLGRAAALRVEPGEGEVAEVLPGSPHTPHGTVATDALREAQPRETVMRGAPLRHAAGDIVEVRQADEAL